VNSQVSAAGFDEPSAEGASRKAMRKRIHLIAAARPNFMKIAPLFHTLSREKWADARIVHTGQHYDVNMSEAFFHDLGLPAPHCHLGVGSGTHGEQTGRVMMAYEKVLLEEKPDLVVVVGDVNSTMAATIAACKLGVPVAHLEAGLRSFDRSMPEEINRVVTDALADLLWTPSPDGDANLLREGVPRERIERVGNIMIDSLEMLRDRIEKESGSLEGRVPPSPYGVVTLHRPSNVDSLHVLGELCRALRGVAAIIPLVFPVHPRTRANLEAFGLMDSLAGSKGVHLLAPMGYIPFMGCVFRSKIVITDSGGLQEETTYLGIPCLTVRPNTERPITIEEGTNTLCGPENLAALAEKALTGPKRPARPPALWDGRTAFRVVDSIKRFLA